jgi:hypothetical protein
MSHADIALIFYTTALSDTHNTQQGSWHVFAVGELDFVPMPDYVVKTLQPPFHRQSMLCGFYVGVPLLAKCLAYILFLAEQALCQWQPSALSLAVGVWKIRFKPTKFELTLPWEVSNFLF